MKKESSCTLNPGDLYVELSPKGHTNAPHQFTIILGEKIISHETDGDKKVCWYPPHGKIVTGASKQVRISIMGMQNDAYTLIINNTSHPINLHHGAYDKIFNYLDL